MCSVLQFFLSFSTIENASAELLALNLYWVFVCDITSSLAWLWQCEPGLSRLHHIRGSRYGLVRMRQVWVSGRLVSLLVLCGIHSCLE